MNEREKVRAELHKLRDNYRTVAAQRYGVKVPHTAHVQPMADGGYVEIVVWISKEDAMNFQNIGDGFIDACGKQQEAIEQQVVEQTAAPIPDDDIPF